MGGIAGIGGMAGSTIGTSGTLGTPGTCAKAGTERIALITSAHPAFFTTLIFVLLCGRTEVLPYVS